jgi:hydroxymethylbilane synthase
MRTFKLGTRGSALALAQTQLVVRALEDHHPHLKGHIEIVPLKTTGDTIVDRSLVDLGGKSLFTKEIEDALLNGMIDIAVHSMKDMAADAPEGLIVPAMLEREDPRDALITRDKKLLEDMPKGSLFGTSSLRRQAHVLHKFPHFRVESLRGNVPTRLQKVENGEFDATLLAVAGLKRLNLLEKATQILSLDVYLPAVAQGAIGIQCREADTELLDLLAPLNHLPTFQTVTAERAFMKAMQGSCRTPIAAYAHLKEGTLYLKGMVSEPQGHNMRFISHEGPIEEALKVGNEAALKLRGSSCTTSS